MSLRPLIQKVKTASTGLLSVTEEMRIKALHGIASELKKRSKQIIEDNQLDLADARKNNLSPALINRLEITQATIESMSKACLEIAQFPQVVGQMIEGHERADKLQIQKQRIPIGVIAMIFESRPNVVIDSAALAIKSGNAIILKGGKEAHHSNRALFEVVRAAVTPYLPQDSIALIETRDEVSELLAMNDLIDLVVPRGGENLIKHVKKLATMPVIAHDRGLCHLYIHKDAEVEKVFEIVLNAKMQRPGVCNALETVLIHQDFPEESVVHLIKILDLQRVEIHACPKTLKLQENLVAASAEDWNTEWLDLKLNMKIVETFEAGIEHIQRYGSHHTEGIVSQDDKVIESFINQIDASCLVINASTRFNDGGELGLGAELGISTSKLHAYGPMGLNEMTTTRFIVKGTGHVRR
jgi:glutamate-5-semialdehyde dehydrogenase